MDCFGDLAMDCFYSRYGTIHLTTLSSSTSTFSFLLFSQM